MHTCPNPSSTPARPSDDVASNARRSARLVNLIAFLQSWLVVTLHRLRRVAGDRGQTTAEYALVLVGVAAIALLVLAWATKTGAIGKLFDFVLQHIMDQVK